jgi:hypothetical protein
MPRRARRRVDGYGAALEEGAHFPAFMLETLVVRARNEPWGRPWGSRESILA